MPINKYASWVKSIKWTEAVRMERAGQTGTAITGTDYDIWWNQGVTASSAQTLPTYMQTTADTNLTNFHFEYEAEIEGIQQAFRAVGVRAQEAAEAFLNMGRAIAPLARTVEENNQKLVTVMNEREAERQEKLRAEMAVEREKRALEAKQKRELAECRGWKLLEDIIGKEAYAEYAKTGHIDVPGQERGVIYRIRPGRRIGILDKDGNEWKESKVRSLCVHPNEMLVEGDVVASQVLLAQFEEKKMWDTANIHRRAA